MGGVTTGELAKLSGKRGLCGEICNEGLKYARIY
jgi:hypothetical protein